MKLVLVLCTALAISGCYRTHYMNFSPENPNRSPVAAPSVPVRVAGWQHFFLYGWAPGTRRIDARQECGEAANIESIRTRRSFVQGLIAAFAGYYINIYSPWDGAVYCSELPPSH